MIKYQHYAIVALIPDIDETQTFSKPVTPDLLPIRTPRLIRTSTCTTRPKASSRHPRTLSRSISPRTAPTPARWVSRRHTYPIIPSNPSSVVLACSRSHDIGAIWIHADIVGAVNVPIPVPRLNNASYEVGGTAVSAPIRRAGRIGRLLRRGGSCKFLAKGEY